MSDTPRTDAISSPETDNRLYLSMMIEHARKLERERNALDDALRERDKQLIEAIAERDALKASLLFDPVIDEMVNRFLSWPLPESVCSDTCVSVKDYCKKGGWPIGMRSGTNLLNADEARKMLEYVLGHRQYVNRCAHEWYQGRCIHCDVAAKNGKPSP